MAQREDENEKLIGKFIATIIKRRLVKYAMIGIIIAIIIIMLAGSLLVLNKLDIKEDTSGKDKKNVPAAARTYMNNTTILADGKIHTNNTYLFS